MQLPSWLAPASIFDWRTGEGRRWPPGKGVEGSVFSVSCHSQISRFRVPNSKVEAISQAIGRVADQARSPGSRSLHASRRFPPQRQTQAAVFILVVHGMCTARIPAREHRTQNETECGTRSGGGRVFMRRTLLKQIPRTVSTLGEARRAGTFAERFFFASGRDSRYLPARMATAALPVPNRFRGRPASTLPRFEGATPSAGSRALPA